jgi:hypothetical protein
VQVPFHFAHRTIHKDVIALAKTYPGALTCASSGVASSGHLLCELFQQETHTSLVHVPYRGGPTAIPDLVSGRIDMLFDALPTVLPHIQAGSVRPIAVLSRQRIEVAEEIQRAWHGRRRTRASRSTCPSRSLLDGSTRSTDRRSAYAGA